MYADDFNGQFPVAYDGSYFWYKKMLPLRAASAVKTVKYGMNWKSIYCPTSAVPSLEEALKLNPTWPETYGYGLRTDAATNGTAGAIQKIKKPSSYILIADSSSDLLPFYYIRSSTTTGTGGGNGQHKIHTRHSPKKSGNLGRNANITMVDGSVNGYTRQGIMDLSNGFGETGVEYR